MWKKIPTRIIINHLRTKRNICYLMPNSYRAVNTPRFGDQKRDQERTKSSFINYNRIYTTYYRLDVQLSKLHVSAFMAIIRLTKDWYQGTKQRVAVPMGSHGLHCLCIYLKFS